MDDSKNEIAAQEELYRKHDTMLEKVFEAIVFADEDFSIRSWNNAAQKMFGWKKQEVLGKSLLMVLPIQNRDLDTARITAALSTSQSWNGEIDYGCKDGRSISVHASFSVMHDENRKSMGIVVIAHDITKRKMTERALRESERKYKSVIDNIHDVFYRSDKNGRLTMCSHSALKTMGCSSLEELIGVPLESFWLDPLERQIILSKIQKDGGVNDYEGIFVRKDGTPFHVSVSAHFYFDEFGNCLGTEGIVRDITERKKEEEKTKNLERELYQSHKLESVGMLAAGVAHDFNNILNIISINASAMEAGMDPASGWAERIESIVKATERGAHLVKQLLTFARRTEIEERPIFLKDLIEEVALLIGATFPKTIDVKLQLDKNLPLIRGDWNQLSHVFMNLCLNSRDAMPEGGKLTIAARIVSSEMVRTKLLQTKAGQYVQVSVADSGCGMDAETRKHIFDPFFTTKVKGKGTGLGLSVVSGIVENHRGKINVRSNPGKGTTFDLYFPAANLQANEQDEIDAAGKSAADESKTITDYYSCLEPRE